MKRLFLALILAALVAPAWGQNATPIHWDMRLVTGNASDRTITVTPLDGPLGFYGTNLVMQEPFTLRSSHAIADTNLIIGNYQFSYSGISKAQVVFWPGDTNITNAADSRIQRDGITLVYYLTNPAPTFIGIDTNAIHSNQLAAAMVSAVLPILTPFALTYVDNNSLLRSLANGGNHTLLHGTTPPQYGAVDAATEITGTLPDGDLSSNVPLKNGNNAYSGSNYFSGPVEGTYSPFVVVPGPNPDGAAGIISALASHNNILLSSGSYDVTNTIRLAPNQTITGAGMNQTFIRYWGYSSNAAATLVGGDWVCIALNTNCIVSDFDIRAMVTNNTVFAASIGRGLVGCTNAWVRRVAMHGDTDCFYWDIQQFMQVTLEDCIFDSLWDALALNTSFPGTGSELKVINPRLRVWGPSFATTLAIPTAIRSAGGNSVRIKIYGGSMISSNVIFNCSSPVEMYGTTITNAGQNLGNLEGGGYFSGVQGLTYAGLVNANRSWVAPPQKAPSFTIVGGGPDGGSEGSLVEDPLPGATYWRTNTSAAQRVFDGLSWRDMSAPALTNKIVVTGETAGGVYNGLYTFKTTTLDAKTGLVFTNYAGKRLMASTNESTFDSPFGISDNESLQDGAEVDLNSSQTWSRGWDGGSTVKAEWALTNLYSLTNNLTLATRATNGNYTAWVSASVALTSTVSQPGQATLFCEQEDGVTNKATIKWPAGTAVTGTMQLSGFCGPNGVYYVKDESGAGASAAIVSLTCSVVKLPW